MSIEVCEGGDGLIWWEWEERDFPIRGASAVDATFQSIVPASQQQHSHARATYISRGVYNPLFGAHVVSCSDDKNNDSEKSCNNTWDASVSANRDNQGNSNYDVTANVQTKTENGFELELGGGIEVRQDREGNVKTDAHGHVSVKGSF